MSNRGIVVAALVVVSTVSLAAGLAAGGRLPFLSDAWDQAYGTVATRLGHTYAADADAGANRSGWNQTGPVQASPTQGGAAPGAGQGADAPPRRQTAPLSSAQLSAPLVHGAFVTACGASDTMKVVVKAGIKMGHTVDVKVTTDPADPAVAGCVDRAVRALQWDISPKLERVTVTY